MNGGELVEKRKDGDAIHHRGFEEEALAASGGEIAEFAIGVDDWSFVGGDGVGAVVKRGGDVIDGGLAVFDVQGGGFEEDVGAGGFQPVSDASRLPIRPSRSSGQECPLHTSLRIEAIGVGEPSKTAGCDSGNSETDPVALAKFWFAVDEQFRKSAVDVAETEEAEVVGVNKEYPRAVAEKPDQITTANAALSAALPTCCGPLAGT